MSETQHTPTPWDWHFLAADKDGDAQQSETMTELLANVILFSLESENSAVIRLSPDINPQLTCANMDFIVRACNAHDELVAACRNALASIQIAKIPALDHSVASTTEILSIIQDSLRAALALVEKEGT